MQKKFPGKRKAIALGVILASFSVPIAAQDDVEIEEVIVTGSFIRGTPLDAPSPVQIVDRNSIEAQGAAIIWDVIKNLEVNSGSFTNSGSGERSQVEGTAQVNLRNLGENSTLVLINGKRVSPYAGTTTTGGEFVDINAIPLVMTERLEILTDGGSALYGADAVAGVVNVIMRTEFEGFDIYADIQGVEAADSAYDTILSGIWGWASDDGDTHFVISAELFERDKVNVLDGNHIDENSQFLGTTSSIGGSIDGAWAGANPNPAYINQTIMKYNLSQGGDGATIYSDPLCLTTLTNEGLPMQIGSLREQRGERSGACREDVARFNFLSRDTERSSVAMAFDHTFSEAVEFYSFFNYMENEITLEGGGLNNTGGSSTTRGPTVFLAQPGAYIRNPYFGFNAIGQTAELGWFAPSIGLTRPTEADIPNAPVSMANGGINMAFFAQPRDGIPRDGVRSNTNYTDSTIFQAGLRGDFTYMDRPWNYDVGIAWSSSSNEQTYQTFNRERTEMAANGLGGPNCVPNGVPDFDWQHQPGPFGGAVPQIWDFYGDGYTQKFFPGYVFTTRESLSYALTSNNQGQGGCEFYNPFLTSLNGDPALANSPQLMDWMNETVLRADKRNKMAVFDAVVGGEFMDMRGGTAAIAIGAQYRERSARSRAPALNFPGLQNRALTYDANGEINSTHYVANNFECSNCIFNFDHERSTKAVFVELSLPFIENVETQIALRYEDYGGNIGSEISPKVAMSWRPIESLLLRGSFSQSFRAPNIGIVEEGLEAGSIVFRDPISNQKVRAGLLDPTPENGEVEQTFTLGGPAPNVGNEYADTYSVGFIWTPGGNLEGLSVQADIWRFEVSDRVLPEPGITAVQPEIDAFLAVRDDPNNYVLNDSIPSDSPEIDIPCDPNALTAQFGVDSDERLNCVVNPSLYQGQEGQNISRLFRNESANLITLTLRAINAGEITADGIDFKFGYSWDNEYGRFRASIDYTHVNQYTLIGVPGLELGLRDTGIHDAAGTTGNGLHVRSLPDNKGNLTLSWQRDRHGVTVINRRIGSYSDLVYDYAWEVGNDLTRSLLRRKISSYSTWDIQYRYAHDWSVGSLGSTAFTVGILDIFNEDLPYREVGGLNYDATVFDPRGRRLYARVLWSF
jgi:outer membrane receptor protein involved in Fe transport